MTTAPERVYCRVLINADRDETTGCLISRYSVGSHGYAQVGWSENKKRVVTLCHLVVWRFVNGPIRKGMTVDHQECRNHKCVEITHLRLLPNLENARRTNGRDWPLGTCAHGHHRSWWRSKAPGRKKGYCRACRALRQAKARGNVYAYDPTKPKPKTVRANR